MTYTYSKTDLSTNLAKVRLAIGDTIEHKDYSLTDEEIQRHLDDTSSTVIAAVRCQEDRVAKGSIFATRNTRGVNADRASVIDAFRSHLEILKKRASTSGGTIQVSAGMTSQATLDAAKDDTDYPDAPFEIGKDDFAGASTPDDELKS